MGRGYLFVLFAVGVVAAVLATPSVSPAQEPPTCLETAGIENCIAGRFRTFWEQNGGLAVFGYPISDEHDEVNQDTGRILRTQWFERNRFESHPENGVPYDMLLGRLGD